MLKHTSTASKNYTIEWNAIMKQLSSVFCKRMEAECWGNLHVSGSWGAHNHGWDMESTDGIWKQYVFGYCYISYVNTNLLKIIKGKQQTLENFNFFFCSDPALAKNKHLLLVWRLQLKNAVPRVRDRSLVQWSSTPLLLSELQWCHKQSYQLQQLVSI